MFELRELSAMRMRYLLAIACALQLVLSPAAQAETVTYTAPTKDQPGKLAGELPIQRVSSILLPNGVVQLADDELRILAVPDWLFDRDVVLRGAIVRAEAAAQQNGSVIGGLVYFYDGQWLNNLASPKAVDVIDTISGEEIRGKIMTRMGQAFAVKPEAGGARKIAFSDIRTISSPRAFRFNIPSTTSRIVPSDAAIAFEAGSILITPTPIAGKIIAAKTATLPKSTLPGTEPGISKSALATFIALDIVNEIAPAIAIPLVLNRSTQAAALNELNRVGVQAAFQQNGGPATAPTAAAVAAAASHH
jgi:hypothetical protein